LVTICPNYQFIEFDTLSPDDGEVDVSDDDEVQELARGCA
jgi:hypothetical protein